MDAAGFTHFGNCMIRCYSTSSADVGKSVTVTGHKSGRVFTGTFSSGLELYFEVPQRDKYTITVLNGAVTEFTGYIICGFGTYYEIETGLRTDTWQGIQAILNAGLENSMLAVGDEMTITTSGGESLIFQIAGIDLESAHQLLWVSKHAMGATKSQHSIDTNVGGWNSSDLRSYLNNTLYAALPDDLKAVIAERTFSASQGAQSSALQEATDKLYIPREYEIFGTTTYATATEHTSGNAQQWPIFATAANRIKTQGASGAAVIWWESSPFVSNSTNFCNVTAAGTAYYGGASTSSGVVPCFQMIATA